MHEFHIGKHNTRSCVKILDGPFVREGKHPSSLKAILLLLGSDLSLWSIESIQRYLSPSRGEAQRKNMNLWELNYKEVTTTKGTLACERVGMVIGF